MSSKWFAGQRRHSSPTAANEKKEAAAENVLIEVTPHNLPFG